MTYKHFYIGLALLALAACDNGGDDGPPPNAAPVLGDIADQSTPANAPSAAIGFTVTDEDANAMTFALSSDNETLVANDAIVLGGGGANRSVTITPTPDMLGDAMIIIIGTDTAGLQASTSFLLTVTAEQKSMQQFTRDTFADSPDGDPELVNAVEFTFDAEDDDFADFLAQ